MTVTLTRETGHEHDLKYEHHLGGNRKLTPAQIEAEERRTEAEHFYHGQEQINKCVCMYILSALSCAFPFGFGHDKAMAM